MTPCLIIALCFVLSTLAVLAISACQLRFPRQPDELEVLEQSQYVDEAKVIEDWENVFPPHPPDEIKESDL
ncbi:MAG: hypothetical protein KME45_02885 [Stenomitos rutilans HA7619-LM2]|jgi:hypothetical protein|nr:hypothetical protein [Stenomitos rutilans HA7619-LM2]MBW4469329.1 hypothetical protein [Stenomitos rutilans HA7619-LM2]